MTGGSLFRRAKKAICRGGSSRGESSRGESTRATETPSTPVHPDSREEIDCSGTQDTSRHSFCGTAPAPEEGVWLVDEQGNPIRRRGRTTCADIQNMPPGTRIHIEERAAKNSENAKKQTCPHTMGRVSSVRRQKETSIKDRLQLWKINRMHKDGTWSSEDAMQRWTQACNLLAEEGLTPEDGNIEANERVFSLVMGPEHSGRVRTQRFGVTPTRYFPQSRNEVGGGSGSNFGQIASLREEFSAFRDEMRQFVQQFQMNQPPHGGSEMGGNDNSSDA